MKNVIVIFGGESCEHDVSVITGVMTLNAINKEVYNPIPVYVAKNGRWYTHSQMCDVSTFKRVNLQKLDEVILMPSDNCLYKIKKGKVKMLCEVYSAVNCCHGGIGEGGGLYGIFKQSRIPCTSSGLFASAVAMDKEFTKIALKAIGIKCLPCVKIERDGYFLRKEDVLRLVEIRLGFPVIIKPSKLGSSIGIKIANDESELERGLDIAFGYDEKVIIEKALQNYREINCAVYQVGGEVIASECEEVFSSNALLTFEDKYQSPSKKEFPAQIDETIERRIKNISKIIYRRLSFSGVIRIDYLLKDEEVFVNEINSVPGSLAYYLFCKTTEEFSRLIGSLVEESVDNFAAALQSKTTFQSGILNLSSAKAKG